MNADSDITVNVAVGMRFDRPANRHLMVDAAAIGATFPKAGSFWDDEPTTPKVERYGSAALLRITGPLTHHDECWFESYDAISQRLDAALAATPRPTSIVMVLDTPGGDASGCFELAASMRKRCAAAGVPLVAYVEGMACSAGYALACAADRIVATPSSIVGSIGVVTGIVDMSGALAMGGVRVRLIKSGARKTDGAPYEPTTHEAEAAIQRLVDGLAALFFAHVAAARPALGSSDAVAALEAGVVLGSGAIAAGLVDEIGTLDLAATPRVVRPAVPAPAPAGANRRVGAVTTATTSPRAARGQERTMTQLTTKPRAEGETQDDNQGVAAEMEQADFARARTATEMPDASAQEVLDALVDSYEAAAGDPAEGDEGEQAKALASLKASLGAAVGRIGKLEARNAELEGTARKFEKRDNDDKVIAALAKRGLTSASDREKFCALADEIGLTGTIRSIEASGPPAPPMGSVAGSPPVASTSTVADVASVGAEATNSDAAIAAARLAVIAENPTMSHGSPAFFRAVQQRARKDNPGAFKRSVN